MVIRDEPPRAVRRACGVGERALRVEVDPVVVDHARWEAKKPDAFVAQLRSQPFVPIPPRA